MTKRLLGRLRGWRPRWFARPTAGGPMPKSGAIYRRTRMPGVIETARVLAVTRDGAGIAHVRVEVRVDGPPYASTLQGERLISATAFIREFSETAATRWTGDRVAVAAE